MTTDPFVYRAKSIAGTQPLFLLPGAGNVAYFDSLGGAPEAPLIAWAETIIEPDGLFLDIGAHVGTWAIVFGLKGHPVRAYEAQPWLARLCNAGLALNGLPATCEPFGLSDRTTELELTSPYADGGCGSVVCQFDGDLPIRLKVQLKSLDSLDIPGRVCGMKVDVEGAELDVLRGAAEIIERDQPKILFECWADERGQRKEELFRYIQDELRYEARSTTWPEMWVAEPRCT